MTDYEGDAHTRSTDIAVVLVAAIFHAFMQVYYPTIGTRKKAFAC